jgi:hypothetical protein
VKVVKKIRTELLVEKPELAEQGARASSWIIEEKVVSEEGGTERVKVVLSASGCPPSYPSRAERDGWLQNYLFDKRPRAPPTPSPAAVVRLSTFVVARFS